MAIIEKTLYVASDGKEFDSRELAERYDEELKKLSGFYAADKYQESILVYDIEKKLREVYYVGLLSRNAFNFYKELCEENGIRCPSGMGVWRYDLFDDEWSSLDEEIEKFLTSWETAVKRLNLKITYDGMKGVAKG